MKIIGITGGVGAGKSYILDYIQENYKARIIKTDEAAELLRTPGHRCYEKIVELLDNEEKRKEFFSLFRYINEMKHDNENIDKAKLDQFKELIEESKKLKKE